MVSVTPDIAPNVSSQTTRSKSREDQSSGFDGFGSLVDSNTAAQASNDRPVSTASDLSAPAQRNDNRTASNDRARQDDDRADRAADVDRDRDRDAQSKSATDAASDGRKAKKDVPSDTKTDTKTDTKADSKDTKSKDGKAPAATDADATASAEQPVAVAAVAVAIPVPVSADVTVAAPSAETNGAPQPLAIAAAILKAQSAASEAAASEPGATQIATPEAEQNFAALIATAKPAAGKTDAKKTITTETPATANKDVDVEADGKTVETAQPQTAAAAKPATDGKAGDVSADGAKPDAAATDAGAAKSTTAAHEHRTDHVATQTTADPLQPATNPAQQLQTQAQPATAITAQPAQLTATLAGHAAVPLNGVAVEIAQSAKAGKSSFDIRLDPAELGRIDVRLEVDKHGNVTSHLTVEKPETLTMLRQDAPQLQRALEQAGFKTNDSGLQFSLRDQSSGQQQNNGENSGRNAQRLVIHEDESVPAIAAGRGYGRMLGSSSGVDISI